MRTGTHPGPSGHPSQEGSFCIPSLEGKRKRVPHMLGCWRTRFLFVPRQRRGGFRRLAAPLRPSRTHPGPSGHPSREGSFCIPSLEGKRKRVPHVLGCWRTRFLFVPRQRRGGYIGPWTPGTHPGPTGHPSKEGIKVPASIASPIPSGPGRGALHNMSVQQGEPQ